jgi:aldehyde:ferredoxin oxidoreductase
LEPVPVEDLGPKKVRLYVYFMNWRSAYNCLAMCNFVTWSLQQHADIVKAVTGWDFTVWELAKVGERAINLARIFNLREGFTEKDDWLPDRFFTPQTSGALSDTAVDGTALERAKQLYYKMMGWDETRGVPTPAKLAELDIDWTVEELQHLL